MFHRIYPKKDCFVTNFPVDGIRATDANVGRSEIIQIFKIASSPNSGSYAHALFLFDHDQFLTAAVSASYTLALFDAIHDDSTPSSFDLTVIPQTQNWDEGKGQDVDYFTDLGVANWLSASNSTSWSNPGAYPTSSGSTASFHFDQGDEDLLVDVTDLVNGPMSASNSGFFVQISPLQETDANDYWIKMFFSRDTHYVDKRPYLEKRWEDWTGSLSSGSSTVLDPTGSLIASLHDVRDVYDSTEIVTLHLLTRTKGYDPAVVATASSDGGGTALTNAYYRIVDDLTEQVLVPFSTGSQKYTKLSWNDQGNYFRIAMSSVPTGSVHRFDFIYKPSGSEDWTFIPGDQFKFRVV